MRSHSLGVWPGWAENRGAVGRGEPQRQPRLQINRGLETPGKRGQERPVCVCFSYSSLSASHTPGVTSRTAVACAGICLCPETRRCSEPAFPDPRCGSDFSRRSGFCGCRGGRGDEPPPSKAIPGYYCYPTGKPAPDALRTPHGPSSQRGASGPWALTPSNHGPRPAGNLPRPDMFIFYGKRPPRPHPHVLSGQPRPCLSQREAKPQGPRLPPAPNRRDICPSPKSTLRVWLA